MKKNLHITIPEEVLVSVKKQAEVEHRNVSNMATVLIERGLEKNKAA